MKHWDEKLEEKENRHLIYEIVDLYEKSRKAIYSKSNPRVVRSRNHVISSQVEDLFAEFFSRITNEYIIIDKSISINFKSKKRKFNPDLIIRNQNSVVRFFDIKLDLGWKINEFEAYCIEKSELIKEVRNQEVEFWKEKLVIDKDIKYELVIVSSKNIGKDKLDAVKKLISKNNLEKEIDIFLLTGDIHPNEIGIRRIKEKITINHDEFRRLKERINTV